MSTPKLITPAANSVLSLDDANLFARRDINFDDVLFTEQIGGAVDTCEIFMRRKLLTQTWECYLSEFPRYWKDHIELPFSPVQSVVSVKYFDTNGNDTTLDASLYQVVLDEPCKIYPSYGNSFPSTRFIVNGIRIQFVVGYGDVPFTTDMSGNRTYVVPQSILHGVKLAVQEMYDIRNSQSERQLFDNGVLEKYLWQYRVGL